MKTAWPFLSVLLLLSCKPTQPDLTGYVEGEFAYIAPTTSGNLLELNVRRGDEVKPGTPLFAIDTTNLEADLMQAAAGLEQAQSQYADLTKGKRPEEIRVIQKQKAQADANLENARNDYNRYKDLIKSKVVSKADFDQKQAAFRTAEAQVQEASANLDVARLGARPDQIQAAQAAIDMAQQKIVQAKRNLSDAKPVAITEGRVEDTLFRVGEFVPAGTPVVMILPPQNVKVRYFVSQQELPLMQLKRPIKVDCDGCKAPIAAHITFISNQAEFTPPVIYSVESRQKLVFMIEATPDKFDPILRPGLPVNIIIE